MIQKTIIANYGDWDMGKTESINLAYIKLQKVATHHEILHTDKDDVCALLEINGVKVGICSQGDPRSCQKGWMKTLVSKDCSIILAACRHYGATVDVIESYKPTYRIVWTSNARLYEDGTNPRIAPKGICARFNDQWATEIANLIESWCYAE
jgi:hypothetical protein